MSISLRSRPALVLAALVALAFPPTAAAVPGTITVSYAPVPGQPAQEQLVLTGTADDEGLTLGPETMSDGTEGLSITQLFGSGVTVAVDPAYASRCENSSFYPGYKRCRKSITSPSTIKVTQLSASLGDGNDLLGADNLGNVAGTSTPITVTASGGPGGDYLAAGSGNDTLNGDAGTDELWGSNGNDTINGGSEADFISGGYGDDTIDAGPGDDNRGSASIRRMPGVYGDPGNDTISGGTGNDELFGGDDNDALSGDAGNDRLSGENGADALDGGDNDDTLDGGSGYAPDGADTYVGGPGTGDVVTYESVQPPGSCQATKPGVRATLDGLANDGPDSDPATPGIQNSTENVGSDVEGISGSSCADELTGNSGANVLSGQGGNDTLNGAAGDDTLNGGSGDETFLAEPGADSYDGGGADTTDVLSYAARSSAVSVSLDGIANDGQIDIDPGTPGNQSEGDKVPTGLKVIGSSVADTFIGSTSGDWFVGGPGADTLSGGAGNDLLDGGTGADAIDGQGDADTVDYSSRTAPVFVNLGDAGTDGEAGEGDVLTNIEGARGGSGNDQLTIGTIPADQTSLFTFRSLDGGGGNDTLTGSTGIDTLIGGPGNDTLTALAGPDRLSGGDGNDTLDGGGDDDVLYGDGGFPTNFAYSEGGTAPAGEGADTLIGGGGNDTLVGGSANDTLQGGDGDDALWGGLGADVVDGAAGNDTISFEYRSSGVIVTVDSGAGNDGGDVDGPPGARDTISSVERITGSQSDDDITATNGNDTLKGLNGNDQLRGLGGDDSLDGGDAGNGGNGADLLDGGAGFDTVTYGGGSWWSGGVNVSLDGVANDGRGDETAGSAKDNVLAVEHIIGSAQGDVITGSSADEIIEGADGADTIDAAGGNDTIIGGGGADTLKGGDGNDLISTAWQDPSTPTYGVGDGARDTVDAGPGDDVVNPNDRGAGAAGNVYDGGPGTDRLTFTGEYEPVRISQDGTANDGVINGGAGDNASGFELLEGSGGNDTITGGGGATELRGAGGADTITGGDGDELLRGGDGDDTLNGAGGNDTLDGGAGKDGLIGGSGIDLATYAGRFDGVKVTLDGAANDGTIDTNAALAGNQSEGDNVQTESVIGGDGADQLIGDAAANTLRGGPGNDTVDGGAGDDTVDGGPGTDTLLSGTGTDVLDAADGEADTLTCDVRDGKTIRVDASLDAFSTCAASAPLGERIEQSTFSVAPFAQDENLGFPGATAGVGSSTNGLPPRAAKDLAKAMRTVRTGTAVSATAPIKVGSTTCGSGRTCTISAQLLAGKRAVAAGTRTGTGKLKAEVRLTSRGWKLVRRAPSTKLTLVVVMTEGGSQATVRRSFTVRRGGSR